MNWTTHLRTLQRLGRHAAADQVGLTVGQLKIAEELGMIAPIIVEWRGSNRYTYAPSDLDLLLDRLQNGGRRRIAAMERQLGAIRREQRHGSSTNGTAPDTARRPGRAS